MDIEELRPNNKESRVWQQHAAYLHDRTPLSERQSEVLALRKLGADREAIGDLLGISPETAKHHWAGVLTKLDQSREFTTIMGPHPWRRSSQDDGDWNNSLWELTASAAFARDDAQNRLRIELELFRGEWNVTSHTYLLVEREIEDVEDWATETREVRGVHEPNALRGHIYADSTSIQEYHIRAVLLEQSGLDPGAEYAPHPESVLRESHSEAEHDAANDHARKVVETPSH